MTDSRPQTSSGKGRFSIVGIGPGLPAHLTQQAKSVIASADTVYAAPLYQSFLRTADLLPDSGSTSRTVIDSARGEQAELARESFRRVRNGEDVVHVSGGDPNVYGKSDLLLSIAEAEGVEDIDIDVIPGVTAAVGGAAAVGAPLGNDFATISLSTAWRDWDVIDERLRGASESGFVLALYNAWQELDRAIRIIREYRDDSVPVAILTDIARSDAGRNPTGESTFITRLDSVGTWEGDPTPGLLVIIGTRDTRAVRFGETRMLVTPRGDYDADEL